MPGFVDGHIHATQYPNSGLGLDLQLLDWLNTYTFPLEVQYRKTEFAREVFPKVVVCLLCITCEYIKLFTYTYMYRTLVATKELNLLLYIVVAVHAMSMQLIRVRVIFYLHGLLCHVHKITKSIYVYLWHGEYTCTLMVITIFLETCCLCTVILQ